MLVVGFVAFFRAASAANALKLTICEICAGGLVVSVSATTLRFSVWRSGALDDEDVCFGDWSWLVFGFAVERVDLAAGTCIGLDRRLSEGSLTASPVGRCFRLLGTLGGPEELLSLSIIRGMAIPTAKCEEI